MAGIYDRKLPNSWEWVSFGEIAKDRLIGLVRSSRQQNPKAAYPYVKMDSISTDGGLNLNNVTRIDASQDEIKLYSLREGDFLFNTRNSVELVGKTAVFGLNKPNWLYNNNIMRVRFNNRADSFFVLWAFHSELVKAQLESVKSKTTNVCAIYDYQLVNIEIPLPPLNEQKRIAAILSKADRLRRLRRYARTLSDGYLQSVFLEMFGDPVSNSRRWECVTIGDVVASSQYGSSNKSNSEQRGYPILGMVNITYSGKIDLTTLAYIELSEDEFKTLRLEPGDIIFNRTNSTELVGKTAHWNYNFDAVLASYLVKLKLKQNVLPDYFTALLNTDYYKRLFQERCKKAVGQSNISPTLLKEFPMLIPPLPLQQKFARIVQKYERLRAQQRESERQTEHLFQSLLHRAFQGEV